MAKSKDNKPTSKLLTDLQTGVFVMTAPLAAVYAKLLNAGCPPIRAVLYCCPGMDAELAKTVSRQWLNDAAVLRAVEEINGGPFIELPKEDRFRLARDKHLSEMAFYLWTSNFSDVEHKEGIEKMRQAREVLKAELGLGTDESDPMQAFARFAHEVLKASQGTPPTPRKKAPQLQNSGLDDLLNKPH